MKSVLDYTYLPWEDQRLAGKICWIVVVIGILFLLVTQLIRRTRLGYEIHAAPFVTMEMTVIALCTNTAAFALFFWYAAFGVSLFFSLMFFISGRGMQKNIYLDEKEGKWGLCPALRVIRGEMFSDTDIAAQIEHKKKVERTFKKMAFWWYFPLTLLLPFALILVLKLCGLPYIFVPHSL